MADDIMKMCEKEHRQHMQYGGREEGREEGRESQTKDTAVRMSKKGISVEEIAEIVGFSTDKVKKWLVTEV